VSLAIKTAPTGLEGLVKSRTVGYSLESPFYTSQDMFDLDVRAIFARHWLLSAAAAEISEPGDYVTVDIGPYSVIIVREDDDEIRAFHNVRGHHGSRLLKEPRGAVGNISGSRLRPVHVKNVGGLVFICLDPDPPSDFDEFARFVEPYLAPYDLGNAKVAHQIDLVDDGQLEVGRREQPRVPAL
jgi:Rieske 2Fe-2S family protein